MIRLHRLDHVCLRVADLDEASARWQLQFGLVERVARRRARAARLQRRAVLPRARRGRTARATTTSRFELARDCSLDDARAHLEAHGVAWEEREGSLFVDDPDGRPVQVMPYRAAGDRGRPLAAARPPVDDACTSAAPRKLGHVNCLTARHPGRASAFYTEVLGMRLSDWLGEAGVWFHVNSDHHVMALVDLGYAHFHHLAFETVDIGKMRDMLDHLARHGRWLGWGPTRHGIAGNIASYVRIVEEECFVELYCDMEQLQDDHVPRVYPDDRYSSNTWGPLPPRSYFRFDPVAVEYERESLRDARPRCCRRRRGGP